VRSAGIITTGYDAYARLTSYANVGVPVFAMVCDGLDQRVQVTAG